MAKRTIKIADILNATTVSDETCIRKLARFNLLLRSYYRDLVETNATRLGECFTGKWEIKIVTKYPILQLHGFYGKWTGKCFVDLDRNCDCGSCDICLTKRINVAESEYYLDNYQYRQDSDNQITLRIDCWVVDWYLVYSRWFWTITNMNQSIEMSIEEEVWFNMLIEIFYAEMSKEFQKASYYTAKYEKWLQKLKERQDDLPVYVWRSYLPNI